MKVTKNEGHITIALKEDFTSELLNEFRSAVQQEIESGNTSFTIDFENAVIIDSMGIGCLVATYNTLKQKGGTMQLSNVSENLKDVFKVMRLDRIFPIV
ncbi:STAS domain-containing protein [bacterium]|nr:STAS domain-containing protein [Desulfobulbaceae bacterium]MCK5682143.1 STAS domain-containing protein [bacterium]